MEYGKIDGRDGKEKWKHEYFRCPLHPENDDGVTHTHLSLKIQAGITASIRKYTNFIRLLQGQKF